MTTASWVDVIARVRGLASRLLGRAELERLAGSRSLAAFVAALTNTGYSALADLSQPAASVLDRETRRIAGERLTILAHWCGRRADALVPLFEDEDRRNLRALTRGVAAHAPADQCAAGLLPTPALPKAALEALAHQPSLAGIAATLMAWGNPYGRAMAEEAARETPSLFALQRGIDTAYAQRATRVAAKTGEPFVSYVRALIDAENARSALALVAHTVEQEPSALFIAGGKVITLEVFHALLPLTPGDARARLDRLLAGTMLAPVANRSGIERDDVMLASMLRAVRRAARIEPLSLHVVLGYVLALRAELRDVARIIWGIALQSPPQRIIARLITP